MPRRSYQITNTVEGKMAQQDQSYRSCVSTLLIFLFLCIILIIVSVPWKTRYPYRSEQEDENAETAQHHHHEDHSEHQTERTTSTTERIKYYLSTAVSVEEESSTELEATTLNYEVVTEDSNIVNVTYGTDNNSSFKSEKIQNIETTTDLLISSTTNDEAITDKQQYNYLIFNTSTSIENDTSITTTEVYEENGTAEASASTELDWTSEEVSSNNYENVTDTVIEFTTRDEKNTTIVFITESEQNTVTYSTVSSTLENNTMGEFTNTTSGSPVDERVCRTGKCKNIASKILFYMNHTVDPCEDFYEYACGGFEGNPQIMERDLEDVAYQRILRQMEKEEQKNISSTFAKYYQSCIQYENINRTKRIKLAKEALNKVGKFYIANEWVGNHTSFTELLARLLLQNSALLFDVAPDLDEYSPKQFTLKIGPTTHKNPFYTDEETNDLSCHADRFEMEKETVDLGKLYREYKTCKKDSSKFIKSITEALKVLDVFDKLNASYNITQNILTTTIMADMRIVKGFYENFPTDDKIREAYLMKNYTRVTIRELEEKLKVVNWTRLIYLLTGELVKQETRVQVYFYDALAKGLQSLDEFGKAEPMLLHNVLLGLYARNLYHELVLSKHQDAKRHCLRVTANVLIPEASNLYISSFSEEEFTYMNKTIHDLFGNLKETLKLKIKEVEWTTPEGRNALIAKIDNLTVAVPDISYFIDNKSTYRKNQANLVNLSDNYFENSVTLMQRYRKLIYAELFTNPGHPEQIWTHYATPYQSKGLAIYGLNLVVIPFGAIDWSVKYDELSFNYIILATLGNVIAHQIAQHFDANGIYYWNGTRDDKNSLLYDHDSTNMNFKEYIDNQMNFLYQDRMNMTLSSTGQTILYEISQLTLNERLSEIMGLRLAYDTLDRLRSSEEVNLPWLELDFDQLFYLTYAQMHCTKSPLTSSYISLYENEQLPSRIRIFVSASNNRLLGKAWNCPEGSRIMPSYFCSAFPYLQCNEATD